MQTFWERLEGTTDQILTEIRRLVAEGNIRRVVVKQQGRTVAEFPVTVGVIGAVIAPLAAAIGALAAVLTDCVIEVEKTSRATPRETSNDERRTTNDERRMKGKDRSLEGLRVSSTSDVRSPRFLRQLLGWNFS